MGYTHCFFVAGGNVMHLIESASSRFRSIPFVHEVGAAIAADYFNEICEENERAFVLVTAGPGLTNVTTAVASAWVDRRELLVIGGQAKSTDLSRGYVKQSGFQEIGGTEILSSITKKSVLIDKQISRDQLMQYVNETKSQPKGPVFLEVCLDITMQETQPGLSENVSKSNSKTVKSRKIDSDIEYVITQLRKSSRPLVLIGGGVSRKISDSYIQNLMNAGIPIATTFNGGDRVGIDYEFYCGHPNWYGSRWANIIIQQSDLVIAIGARLGLMQTGYNWQEFVPNGKVIQVEIEQSEIEKPSPSIDLGINFDPDLFLEIFSENLGNIQSLEIDAWHDLIRSIRENLAKPDAANKAEKGFVEFYKFSNDVMERLSSDDLISPCSSGGSFESFGRIMLNKSGQKWVLSPGLASMGFGLSGGIGMSLAYPNKRTIIFEGDGGLAQNLQEFGVMRALNLNIKMFISDNAGYGSIKSHQKAAFNNHYIGCDRNTGLWLPDWESIAKAFDIPFIVVTDEDTFGTKFETLFAQKGPAIFVVKVDPNQIFYPKILSQKNEKGEVTSNPLHMMEPSLSLDDYKKYIPHIKIS